MSELIERLRTGYCGLKGHSTVNPKFPDLLLEAADRIAELESLVKSIHDDLEYGEIYQWDNGNPHWLAMRKLVDSLTSQPDRENTNES